jgi:putative endonuclease
VEATYYVYLLASQRNGTLYVGVTSDILRRAWEHREGLIPGFTRDNGVKRLVWYEQHGDVREAIAKEKRLKRRRREWELVLIEEANPQWRDLWDDLLPSAPHGPLSHLTK